MRYSAYLLVGVIGLLSGCSAPAVQPLTEYRMGEKVRLGRLIYTVFETQWLTQLGDAVTGRVPEHRFLLVRFSAANSGGSENPVPSMTIQDDQGKSYEELPNGDGVPQWAGYLRNVKPAESVQGNVIFDAPPARYKLKLSDESGSNFALVDIPLTFGAEPPPVPLPAAK
jgi:hypothetical protein